MRFNNAKASQPTLGQARLVVMGATPGQEYVLSVKYNVKSIIGSTFAGAAPTCNYDFVTKVNYDNVVNEVVAGSDGSIKAYPGCSDNTPLPPDCKLDSSITASSLDQTNVDFAVYPVPFKETLTVKYEFDYKTNVTIQIFDIRGSLLMTHEDTDVYYNKEVQLQPRFNVGEGQMFFVKVITNRGVSVQKVISQK